MPTKAQVDRAINLIQKGGGNYEYFFGQLSSPSWIAPLAERGRFNHPPPLERVSNNAYRIPPWPEGHYLLRMASVAPDEVAKAIGPECYKSDNPLVHMLLVEIATNVPGPAAKDIADRELGWLAKQRSSSTLYPEKAAALIIHLIDEGETETALGLSRVMLQVWAPEPKGGGTPIELEDGTTYTYRPSPEPEGRMEPVLSELFRHRVIPTLAAVVAPQLLKDLAHNLNEAVTVHNSNHADDSDDYSTIWRQFIDNGSHHGTLDESVSAMADAIKILVEQAPGSETLILDVLRRYKWPIFDRLSAYTLKIAPNVDKNLLGAYVSDPSKFARRSDNPEFADMLTAKAGELSPDVLEAIFKRIDQGPDPASYEYHLTHRVRPEDRETMESSIVDQWTLDWLHPLAGVLDEQHKAQLDKLLTKFNPPAERPFRTSEVFGVQDHSPVDLDDFKAMPVPELVEYLRTWTPPTIGMPFDRPSRAGLGATLAHWVRDNPQRASESIDHFLTTELDPIYLTSMLDAFQSLLRDKSDFDAFAVSRAARWVAESTDAIATKGEDDGWHRPTWNWAHMSAARFMAELMLKTERLDLKRADELFATVRAMCYLPHPTPEEEGPYKKESSRYASFALNTPRPVGVEAMIRYGCWLKTATPEAEFNREQLTAVFGVLEDKLDPVGEPSVAVREMFGMQFRTLAWLDREWFISVVPKLFPGKNGKLPQEKTLDRFAWRAYLHYGGRVLAMLPAMRNRYATAIKSLQRGATEIEDADRTLASHLMQFYAHGKIELDDPLLTQFFALASRSLRAQAVGDIGWIIGKEAAPLGKPIKTRLMSFWESRMFLLKGESRDDAKELETFGWWIASGKFPEQWAVEQAMRILEVQRALRPDFAVVKTFAGLAKKYPYEAVRVVRVLLEEDRDGWSIHGWSQHLDAILEAALQDGDNAKAEAAAMIHLLAARGFRSYRRLLPS
jgi:hypothetical protein